MLSIGKTKNSAHFGADYRTKTGSHTWSGAKEPNGSIVRSDALQKTYDTGKTKVEALKGVTLTIKKGEMVAIMGPSGCGKTTLLNTLSGLDSITDGDVEVDGVSLNELSDNEKTEIRAKKMGFIFQFYNLLPVLDAVENVELPLLLSGVKPKEARKRAVEMLALVGLKGWEHHRPAELSGGQRQRVTIARALVNNPAIVWGDEPTGDLDSNTSQEIMDLLCKLNIENNQTFVIVTHDLNVAKRAHRIITMRNGRIHEELPPGVLPSMEFLEGSMENA
ncbi:MAG: ABC transporter ATP-binding protein [Thermoplasmata archaeon]|nr:MAG: ABC transporter ATP-binding protein [Thermoplasmata archaeon]